MAMQQNPEDTQTCDYCDAQYGDMTRATIPPLAWCGHCDQGLEAVFGGHTDAQLKKIVAAADDMESKFGSPDEFRSRMEKKFEGQQIAPAAHKMLWEVLRMSENAEFARQMLSRR